MRNLFICSMALLFAGCVTWPVDIPTPVDIPAAITNLVPPVVTTPPVTNTYVIGKWHGPSGANAKVVQFAIRSVSIKGGKLYLDHDPIPWGKTGDMTVICMAALDGDVWEGGKFDWIMPATGQKVKLTENIVDNYNKIIEHLREGAPVLVWWMRVHDMKAATATEMSPFFLTEWHK